MKRRILPALLALALGCGSSAGPAGSPGSAGNTGRGGVNGGTAGSSTGTGTGGTTATGTGGTVATGNAGSVLERNNHPSRDGLFVQPQITKAAVMAAKKTKDAGFSGAFTGMVGGGVMYASPLYVQNGPGGKAAFVAATTDADVFAIDEKNGTVLPNGVVHIGRAAGNSGAGCGNVQPLGIISTPVIDPTAGKLYVAAALGTASAITRHEVHAISIADWSDTKTGGWPVDITPVKSGSVSFSAALTAQNQRGALSLLNGILYVPYGGHAGDCGSYRGWVVAINAANPTTIGAWVTGGMAEGIWCPGGMASDGTGVFASTGNDLTMMMAHVDSEEVVKVTGMGTVDKSSGKNHFFPSRWMSMDGGPDLDLGSVNPVYISEPAPYIIQISKDGHFYVLDAKNLGGMGGQLADLVVAASGMNIHTVPTAYKTGNGMHVAFTTDGGAMCPMGMPSGKVVMSVSVPAGSPPKPQVLWCAALGGAVTAPITTTTDGTNDAVVWYVNSGELVGLDGDTGAVIYTSSDTCSGVEKFTSPIAVNGRIIVGGDTHLCAWTVR